MIAPLLVVFLAKVTGSGGPNTYLDCFCEHPLLYGSPTTGGPAAAGIGVRFGADFGSSGLRGSFDEGKTEDAIPTVGQLSRHNLRVAAARNCRELARYDRTDLESVPDFEF